MSTIGSVNAFISIWKTDNAGTSGTNQITLPLVSSGTYNFKVYWGDGTNDTITTYNQAEITHTYPSAGTYEVLIAGTIDRIKFDGGGDKDKLLEIKQWGTPHFLLMTRMNLGVVVISQ